MTGNLNRISNIGDLRRVYLKRVPKLFADYCESGAGNEQTLRANTADFDKILFRQKVLCDLSQRSLKTHLLGEEAAMPLILAPVGLTGLQRADGEILAAQAAERFGVPYVLSTMSICSLEDVAAHTQKPFWFQLYVMRDRGFVRELIARAKAAGCSVLLLTADLQMLGHRHADVRNGLGGRLAPAVVADLLSKWRWLGQIVRTRRRGFGNIDGHLPAGTQSAAQWINGQFDPALTWDDAAWIKAQWGGKMAVKGIMEADDARRAVAAGADAVVVSNHGGRQLDGAPSAVSVLPEIVAAVGGQCEIWADGGINSGQNLLKAVALGADAAMAGRAYIYGLGAYGAAGVSHALEILYRELDLAMAFCGKTDIRQAGREILRLPENSARMPA